MQLFRHQRGWPTIDVCAEVDLADIIVLQDSGISGIGSVVGSTMVQGAASREGQAGVQPVLLYQLTRTVLQSLTGGEMLLISTIKCEPN